MEVGRLDGGVEGKSNFDVGGCEVFRRIGPFHLKSQLPDHHSGPSVVERLIGTDHVPVQKPSPAVVPEFESLQEVADGVVQTEE